MDIKKEYAIQRAIDASLDNQVIPQVMTLVRSTQVKKNRKMGRAQFTNLQNVTRDTTSVQVILTWIRYQMGRGPAWNEGDFGKKLLDALDNDLQEIAEDIARVVGAADEKEYKKDVRDIHLRLIRQYVGQLQRLYVGSLEGTS